MVRNFTDSEWLFPKLVLLTYAIVILAGLFGLLELVMA